MDVKALTASQATLTVDVKALAASIDKYIESQAKERDRARDSQAKELQLDVTWATETGLYLKGLTVTDVVGRISNKFPDRGGVIQLEWDGLLLCREIATLFCVEAKTSVRRKHVDGTPPRLQRMAEYFHEVERWLEEEKPEGAHKDFVIQAERIKDLMKDIGPMSNLTIKGVIGPLSSGTGPLAKRVRNLGLYGVLKGVGRLVAADEDHNVQKPL